MSAPPPAELPRVAVVVVNWNNLQDTVRCLESLLRSDYPAFQAIVVDNGSSGDDVARLRERFGETVQVIPLGRNLGFAGGCNVGIQEALAQGADYVLLLNNDALVAPDCLRELVRAARARPDAAALCPKIYHLDRPGVIQSAGGRVSAWRGRSYQVGRDEPDRGQYDEPAERDYTDGACMLMSRPAIEAVGLLDEEYFAYWEETDWCDRARSRGFKCYYVPTARAWHRGITSFSSQRYRYLYRRSAFLFLRKRRNRLYCLSALLYHILVLAPAYLLRRPRALLYIPTEARALLWHLRHRVRR